MQIRTLILFLFFSTTYAAENLSLTKFLQLAESNDPEYEKIFSDKNKAKFLVDQGLPSSGITLNLDGEYGSSSSNNSSTINGSIEKSFLSTGTNVSVAHTQTNQTAREEKITKVRLEQSLLKNVFGRDTRLKKKLLGQQEQLLLIKVAENYENYLTNIILVYLNFQKSYLVHQLAQQIHSEAQKLNHDVKKRYKSKIATSTDLARSELLLLTKKEDLIEKKNALKTIELQVRSIIGEQQAHFLPIERMDFIKTLEAESSSPLKKDIRPIEISSIQEQISKKEMKLTNRNLYPDVNFVAGYNRDDSERYSSVINEDEAIIGVNISIPLGNSQKQADAKIAAIEHYKEQLGKRKTLVDIKRSSHDLMEKIDELKKIVAVNEKKIELTKKILKDEERRYAIGKIELENLIEIKNSYAEYRLEYQSNKLEYAKALVQWLDLADRLSDLRAKL